MRVTIRHVSEACPAAASTGTADLRDAALEVAPRVAPPGSGVKQVAEIAAALILVGAEQDPSDHGLSIDEETLALAVRIRGAMEREREPPEARVERAERAASRALADAAEARAEIERLKAEVATLRAEVERLSAAPAAPPTHDSPLSDEATPPEGRRRGR